MKKLLFFLLAAPLATPAHAHFLWAQTDAEKHTVNLTFGEGGEGVIQGVKPEVLQKATLWKPSGQKLPLQLTGGAYRASLDQSADVYGAHQSWGVLDRTANGRGIFRLEYFAKAATSLDKAGFGARLPLELFARREGNQALITLKRGSTVVPNASLTVTEPLESEGKTLQTNAQGQVRFPLDKAGLYALRALTVESVPGELEGKKYPQTRTWTTLTFHVANEPKAKLASFATGALPTKEAMGNSKADPRAYALLEAAHNNRQVMPATFAGFQANLIYRDGETTRTGKLVYRRAGETQIRVEGLSEADQSWLEEKVMNLIGHRRGGTFAQGDGKNPLTLGDKNAYGQLITLNDRMASEYRVKDGKVTEVTRTIGGQKFTITVMDTMEADPGKYLANHFSVAYRDAATNVLQRVEGYHDSYAQIDGVWIPTGRTVIDIASSVSPRVRSIDLRNIEILKPQD